MDDEMKETPESSEETAQETPEEMQEEAVVNQGIPTTNGTKDDPAYQDERFVEAVKAAETEAAVLLARQAAEAAEEEAHQAEIVKAQVSGALELAAIRAEEEKTAAELEARQIEVQIAAAAAQKAAEAVGE